MGKIKVVRRERDMVEVASKRYKVLRALKCTPSDRGLAQFKEAECNN